MTILFASSCSVRPWTRARLVDDARRRRRRRRRKTLARRRSGPRTAGVDVRRRRRARRFADVKNTSRYRAGVGTANGHAELPTACVSLIVIRPLRLDVKRGSSNVRVPSPVRLFFRIIRTPFLRIPLIDFGIPTEKFRP